MQLPKSKRSRSLCAEGSKSTASVPLRGFTYQAIGQLGERVPSLLSQDTDIPRRLFHALAVEPPGVRASLQEALSALSNAFIGAQGQKDLLPSRGRMRQSMQLISLVVS